MTGYEETAQHRMILAYELHVITLNINMMFDFFIPFLISSFVGAVATVGSGTLLFWPFSGAVPENGAFRFQDYYEIIIGRKSLEQKDQGSTNRFVVMVCRTSPCPAVAADP